METRDNFLRPPTPTPDEAGAGKSIRIPTTGDTAAANLTSSSGSSSSLTQSPPNFLHQLHDAVKRQRPLGSVQSNIQRATRVLVPRAERAKKGGASPSPQNPERKVMQPQRGLLGPSRLQNATPGQQKVASSVKLGPATPDQLMLATPSMLENLNDSCDQSNGQKYQQKSEVMLVDKRLKPSFEVSSSQLASQDALLGESFKKEQSTSQRDNFPAKQGEHDHHVNHHEPETADAAVDMDAKYDAANLSERGIEEVCNRSQGEPMTRCSAIGSSVTALSIHSGPTVQSIRASQSDQYASSARMPDSAAKSSGGVPSHGPQKQPSCATGIGDWNPDDQQIHNPGTSANGKAVSGTRGRFPSEGLSANVQSTSGRDGSGPQANKGEKERHKKNYDPNVFFKVNGKLYQKLGKIGSGGSSEVHKVISAECSIYALKRIKLKGRDYPTAYGFCQEIEYLNKLKGKNNIIQLIDYEVTDKTLFREGSMSHRDGRIKDDHYIYMVLEYGEIDLAHMVAQKWKERNNSNMKIDENWLRFYWQQMLEAVNTIHEERIVHSDLKPANFMLVRGSLKLIDFGIAKAIMNDTTNIQRDAQVGTLNYMSPEAFMCNDQDAGGNIIKCGRPSDIWSLGCILYQMVYGKTPFADYKTFWAKYKEVTNRNHKIKYESVDNSWLLDLMQRCLAWDRDERWRIPQLLQHPFLNPPVAPMDLPATDYDTFTLLMERARVHWANPEVSRRSSEFYSVLHSLIEKLEKGQCS